MTCEVCKENRLDVKTWKFTLGSVVETCTPCARKLESLENSVMIEAKNKWIEQLNIIIGDK